MRRDQKVHRSKEKAESSYKLEKTWGKTTACKDVILADFQIL